MTSFLVAVQFLTRLPTYVRAAPDPSDVGGSIAWFPVVGLLIGAMQVGLDRGLSAFLEFPVANAALIWAMVAITGALHLDGLIDTADGLEAARDPLSRLEAMRQSTTRTSGALAGCTLLLLLFAALSGLTGAIRPIALLLAPMIGRTAIVLGYRVFPYPRAEATVSRWLKDSATIGRTAAAVAVSLVVVVVVGGAPAVFLLLVALLLALGIGRLLQRWTTGVTGDGHGAICEVTQLAVLMAAPILLYR